MRIAILGSELRLKTYPQFSAELVLSYSRQAVKLFVETFTADRVDDG